MGESREKSTTNASATRIFLVFLQQNKTHLPLHIVVILSNILNNKYIHNMLWFDVE